MRYGSYLALTSYGTDVQINFYFFYFFFYIQTLWLFLRFCFPTNYISILDYRQLFSSQHMHTGSRLSLYLPSDLASFESLTQHTQVASVGVQVVHDWLVSNKYINIRVCTPYIHCICIYIYMKRVFGGIFIGNILILWQYAYRGYPKQGIVRAGVPLNGIWLVYYGVQFNLWP